MYECCLRFRMPWCLLDLPGREKPSWRFELADRLDAEIISMDSMALYRGMDIGTAKPTPEQCRHKRHHLIDVLEPWQSASVAWWLEQAASCSHEIEARGKQVLFRRRHAALSQGAAPGPF